MQALVIVLVARVIRLDQFSAGRELVRVLAMPTCKSACCSTRVRVGFDAKFRFGACPCCYLFACVRVAARSTEAAREHACVANSSCALGVVVAEFADRPRAAPLLVVTLPRVALARTFAVLGVPVPSVDPQI